MEKRDIRLRGHRKVGGVKGKSWGEYDQNILYEIPMELKKILLRGWRDSSAVKSTDCSSIGPEFESQQPHGGSQPSVMRSDAWSKQRS